MKRMYRWLVVLAAVVLTGSLGACGGGGSSSSDAGTLQVAITDLVAEDFLEVTVAIREIALVKADCADGETCEVQTLAAFDPAFSRNVLELAYQQELLGEAKVPEGDYNQVRLVLAPNEDGAEPVNYVVLADEPGIKYPLATPSGTTSGIKVLGKFNVTAGESTAIVLDFDPSRAVLQEGNGDWKIKPTGIRIVAVEEVLAAYGALSGTLLSEAAWETAAFAVYPEGSALALAAGLVHAEDGTFRAQLPAGIYHLEVTADGYQAFESSAPEAAPAGPFEVVIGEDTVLEDIVLAPAAETAAAELY